jgi:hypothetical protein
LGHCRSGDARPRTSAAEAPNNKHQITNKNQTAKRKIPNKKQETRNKKQEKTPINKTASSVCDLEFAVWNLFAAWCLLFGACYLVLV